MSEPRRIYTRIVMQWDDEELNVVESESYLHDGPVAECMPSDGAGGRSGGDGDRGSGGSSDSGRGGNEGGYGGYGGLGIGNPGSYGGVNDPGRTSEGGYSKSGGGQTGFGGFAGSVEYGNPSIGYGSPDAAYSRSVHASTPDQSAQISELTGRPVSRTDVGYVDETGTRMAYSSGDPTSYGAQATAREGNLGMSWDGAKAMSSAAQTSRVESAMAKAREIQARTTAALKDPVALGLDPHQAMAAYNDVMHGMYDKAVSVGAMTPDEAKTVQHAFGGLGGMLGMGTDDVTTDYESSVSAIESGLMDPTTGKLTAKGWMNVASPVLGMLAGPLSSIGLSMAGIPGAIAGAIAPSIASAYASPKSTNAIDAATGMASKVTGIDMSPFGAGLAYANTMNTMGKAQQYAGTAPSRPERTSYEGGDGASDIDESFMAKYDKFISAPTGNNAAVNPAFQSKFDNRGATVKNNATKQPVQPVQQQRVTGFNPLAYNKFYTAGV